MHYIRFIFLVLLGFILTLSFTILVPISLKSSTLEFDLCTTLNFNPNFCLAISKIQSSGQVIATTPPKSSPIIAQVGGIRHSSSSQVSQIARQKGTSYGDPHMITFDGLKYSFQTMGEYVLVLETNNDFEVQTRQKAVPDRQISLNTAVAMRVGKQRIAFYAQDIPDSDDTTPLRVNGRPVTLANNARFQLEDGSISRPTSSDYVVDWAEGYQVRLRISKFSGFDFINVTPAIPSSESGKVIGLLGNFDGNSNNDLQTRQGKVIPSQSTYGNISQILGDFSPVPLPLDKAQSLFFQKLNQDFGDSWRISQEESLFDYLPNQSTQTFTQRSFPKKFLTLASLSSRQVREAEEICREAEITDDLLEGCIFDVGVTGEAGFAQAAANLLVDVIQDRVEQEIKEEIRDRVPIRIPRLPF